MLGEVIHGYRIERAIADDKGGFGMVFFARHVDSGAEAVVKMLRPEMSAMRDIVARFFNEARAAASVHHPGIVQIHNVGYHRDHAYLLMERLHGEDLETRLAAGAVPLDRALVFLRQAAGAVGAAHERGIVHRDLKPANLFIVPDPDVVGGERIKVLDFGIAKLTVDSAAGATQGVFGTPAYMSPEQCASAGAVDHRADLYSLGCIFYELVCGRPPFGFGGIELIAAHLRDQPLAPRAVAPWLPPAIEAVILSLLAKPPDLRLASCAALIAQLDAITGSMPTLPRLPSITSPGVPAVPAQTTLGAAAGAGPSAPPARRGLWIGAGALVVGAGVAAVVLLGRGSDAPIASPEPPPILDAAAPPPVDAAQVAPDAPPLDAPDEPPIDAPVGDSTAEKLNTEGTNLMYAGNYASASEKFGAAIEITPEPKYFFNLCVAETNEGRLADALSSCQAVLATDAAPGLKDKATKMIVRIRQIAQDNHVALPP